MKKNNPISSFFSSFLDVLFPPRCALCRKKSPVVICGHCMDVMPLHQPPFCFCCGKSLKNKNVAYPLCAECRTGKRHVYFHSARAAGIYDGSLRRAIHVFKYQGNVKLAPALSELLYSFLSSDMVNAFPSLNALHVKDEHLFPDVRTLDGITFVPMDEERKRQRGFNQSELLARELSKKFSLPLVHGLRKKKSTKAQVKLSGKERWQNVRGAFFMDESEKARFKGKSFLLVDDVFTTGATASECSKALRKCGAKKIFVATLANTS